MRTVGPALLTAALVLGAAACGSSTTTIPTGNGGSVTLNNDGTSGWKAQIKGTGSAKECSANAISKLEGKGFTKREEVNLGGASQAALTSPAAWSPTPSPAAEQRPRRSRLDRSQ
jgi:hypothetical protein